MKKKIICIFLILILLVILGFFIYKNFIVKNDTKEEIQDYTPQEEISEQQLRETKINSVFLEGDILKIDFSNEFLNSDNLNNSANSILNTVTQLNEINGIKILINGEENKNFKDTIYLEKNN